MLPTGGLGAALPAPSGGALRWCGLDAWRGRFGLAWLCLADDELDARDAALDLPKVGAPCEDWLAGLVNAERERADDECSLVLGVGASQAARLLRSACADADRCAFEALGGR